MFLSVSPFLQAQPSIRLSSVSWEIGDVKEGELLRKKLTISNVGDRVLEVNARSGCSCLSFNGSQRKVKPGEEAVLELILNTKAKSGPLTESLYLDTNDPAFQYITYLIELNVISKAAKAAAREVAAGTAEKTGTAGAIRVLMFSSPGCNTCKKLKADFLPEAAKRAGLEISLETFTLDKKENYEKFVTLESKLNDTKNKFPALVLGGRILGGEKEIRRGFEALLKSAAAAGTGFNENEPGVSEAALKERLKSIKLLPIILAGLLDGINPCAFATIIFFVSYLAFTGKNGAQLLSTGIAFSFAVFLSYTLIGLGFFNIIEKTTAHFPFITAIIKWLTVLMVFILGILSIYDWIKCRQGKLTEMKLQLSGMLKDRIHKSIVDRRSDFSGRKAVLKLAFAGFSIGVLVSVFEFACTGQIYLPTIIYMQKLPHLRLGAIVYLVIYNLMFVLPLVIIFLFTWKGTTSSELSGIMTKHIGTVKLAMVFFFFGIGIMLLLIY